MGIFDIFKKKTKTGTLRTNSVPHVNSTATDHALTSDEIIKNSAEMFDQLVNDPIRYRAYLENVLSQISFNKKDQIIRTVIKGDKAEAMRKCQRTTREGLRVVKDLMADYMIFPNLKYFSSRIYIKNATRADIEDSLREYGEIYTDTSSGNTYIGAIYGTDWNYVEFYSAVTDPASFTFDIFLNLVIWMSQKSNTIFAYAKPTLTAPIEDSSALSAVGAWADITPFYATIDTGDSMGESCIGVLNNKNFRFVVPDLTISYGDSVAQGFDIEKYIEDTYKMDLSRA